MKYIKYFENKKQKTLDDFLVEDDSISDLFLSSTDLYTELLLPKEESIIKNIFPQLSTLSKSRKIFMYEIYISIIYKPSIKSSKYFLIKKHDDYFYFKVVDNFGPKYYKCDQLSELKIFLNLLK